MKMRETCDNINKILSKAVVCLLPNKVHEMFPAILLTVQVETQFLSMYCW